MRTAYLLLLSVTFALAGESPDRHRPPRPIVDPAVEQQDAAANAAPANDRQAKDRTKAQGKSTPKAQAQAKAGADQGEPGKAPATAPAPPSIEHDTVILTNEQHFRGTVLANQPDPDWVAINTGSGVLNLRRDLVARVEYGLTARMGQVKSDDLNGLVELAYWCRANQRNREAFELLTKAVAIATCDVSARGLYAQLVDELEGAEKALPLYIAYRNAGGGDEAILARLNELEAARRVWEEQMRALNLDPSASAANGQPTPAATSSRVVEGYEQYRWEADKPDWSSPATPALTTLVTPEGPRRVLQIDFEPHPSKPDIDKAAVVLRRPLSLRAGSVLTMMAANRGDKDIRIGIAIKTGNEWTYFESKPQVVKATTSGQEFAQLRFDLSASDFKAKSTDWSYSASIANLDQVREMQILIHNGRASGSVWLAGIDFTSDPVAPTAP
jgi:hypothetical protein